MLETIAYSDGSSRTQAFAPSDLPFPDGPPHVSNIPVVFNADCWRNAIN